MASFLNINPNNLEVQHSKDKTKLPRSTSTHNIVNPSQQKEPKSIVNKRGYELLEVLELLNFCVLLDCLS